MLKELSSRLLSTYFSEQARWVHWIPVGLIFGIGTYFTLSNEPGFFTYLSLLLLGAAAILCTYKNPDFGLIACVIAGFCVGFCIIGVRVHLNVTQMFNATQESTDITGRIQSIENHPYKDDGTYRIILDQVKINDTEYSARLRLNISGELAQELQIHDQVNVVATIYPIPMPSSLHGYFARRAAYLQGIGGTAKMNDFLSHEKAEAKP